MGERLLCKQEVDGSIPFTSTTVKPEFDWATGRSAPIRGRIDGFAVTQERSSIEERGSGIC